MIHDGTTVMIGGFLACGNPHNIIDAILENGTKDLTIVANDSPATGVGLESSSITTASSGSSPAMSA